MQDANGKERPGFDLGMLSNYWWNFVDNWLPDSELPMLKKMAKYGGAAAPDNHDTPDTLAGMFRKAFKNQKDCDRVIADISVRNYAISAFIGNSVFMQMGYELSKETQNGVFKGQGSPKEWDDLVKARPVSHVMNIETRVKAINDLKKSLGVENCYVNITEHSNQQDGKLVRIGCEYIDADTGQKMANVVLLVNKKPENGPISVTDTKLKDLENSEFKRMGAAGENMLSVKDVIIYHTPVEDIIPTKMKPVSRAIKKAYPGRAS